MEPDERDDDQGTTTEEPGVTAEELRAALCRRAPEFCAEALKLAMDSPALACKVSRGILEEALAEIAWLPGGDGYDILGDDISADMAAILWSVCGGCSDCLLSLVDHAATSLFLRNATLAAITIGVCEGVLDREEMLRVVHERLEAMLADDRPMTITMTYTASWLAETIVSLGVGDSSSLLDHAYEVGLNDGGDYRSQDLAGGASWHTRGGAGAYPATGRLALSCRSHAPAKVALFFRASPC